MDYAGLDCMFDPEYFRIIVPRRSLSGFAIYIERRVGA